MSIEIICRRGHRFSPEFDPDNSWGPEGHLEIDLQKGIMTITCLCGECRPDKGITIINISSEEQSEQNKEKGKT